MLYVLRYVHPGPDDFLEYASYDEGAIPVRNKIALCRFEHTKDLLANLDYKFLGTIEQETDLPKLLEEDKKIELTLGIRGEKVPLKDVLIDKKYQRIDGDEQDKPWYENLQ